MKAYLKLLFATVVIFAFTSCEYETIVPDVIAVSNVSFSTDIQPIFTASCIGCHSGQKPVLKEGEAYNNLKSGGYIDTADPENSLLYQKLIGSMSSYIKESERQYILIWIQEGAKDN